MPPSATSAGRFHLSVGAGQREMEKGHPDEGCCRRCRSQVKYFDVCAMTALSVPRSGHVESLICCVVALL